VHVLPEDCEAALLVALVGAPPQYVEANRLLRLGNTSTGVETVSNRVVLAFSDCRLSVCCGPPHA